MNYSTTELLETVLNPTESIILEFNRTFPKKPNTQLRLYDILIPSIGVFIIIINFAVVISSGLILKKGQEPRSTYMFLGNVAMCDLITGISTVMTELLPKEGREHYRCTVQLGLIVSSTLSSVISVGLIAVDRFLYILYGLKYQKWVYPNRARFVITLSWIAGCLIGFLPLFGWHQDETNGRACWFILIAPKELILLTVTIGIIPLLIVIVLYSTILYHALKKIVQLKRAGGQQGNTTDGNIRMFRGNAQEQSPPGEEHEPKGIFKFFKKKPSASVKSPNKWKAIKVVLFTAGAFFCTWGPYFIFSLIYSFECDRHNETAYCKRIKVLLASPLAILGFLNSLLNPIIYAWWHNGFRAFVKDKIIRRICWFRKNDTSRSQSSTAHSNVNKNTSSSNNDVVGMEVGETLDRTNFDQGRLEIEEK